MNLFYNTPIHSFTSSNSSFTDCVRQYNLSSLSFSLSSFSNEAITGNYYAHKDISQTATVTTCSFNCESSISGGAIYFTGSSSSLTITDSIFYQCNSTGGWGGGVFCDGCSKVIVQQSSFIECFCTSSNAMAGGAMIDSSTALPEIKENSFFSCSSAQDAGGLYLYRIKGGSTGVNLPMKECIFFSCIAHGYPRGDVSDADGGGMISWMNEYTLGISDSLFAKCESKKKAGGSFLTLNKVYFHHIVRFCFYCNNVAPNGTNTLIHFNG